MARLRHRHGSGCGGPARRQAAGGGIELGKRHSRRRESQGRHGVRRNGDAEARPFGLLFRADLLQLLHRGLRQEGHRGQKLGGPQRSEIYIRRGSRLGTGPDHAAIPAQGQHPSLQDTRRSHRRRRHRQGPEADHHQGRGHRPRQPGILRGAGPDRGARRRGGGARQRPAARRRADRPAEEDAGRHHPDGADRRVRQHRRHHTDRRGAGRQAGLFRRRQRRGADGQRQDHPRRQPARRSSRTSSTCSPTAATTPPTPSARSTTSCGGASRTCAWSGASPTPASPCPRVPRRS